MFDGWEATAESEHSDNVFSPSGTSCQLPRQRELLFFARSPPLRVCLAPCPNSATRDVARNIRNRVGRGLAPAAISLLPGEIRRGSLLVASKAPSYTREPLVVARSSPLRVRLAAPHPAEQKPSRTASGTVFHPIHFKTAQSTGRIRISIDEYSGICSASVQLSAHGEMHSSRTTSSSCVSSSRE